MYRDSRPRMMTQRDNVNMMINLGQIFNDLGRPRNVLPPKKAPGPDVMQRQHNALTDAQWDKDAFDAMMEYKAQLARPRRPIPATPL